MALELLAERPRACNAAQDSDRGIRRPRVEVPKSALDEDIKIFILSEMGFVLRKSGRFALFAEKPLFTFARVLVGDSPM